MQHGREDGVGDLTDKEKEALRLPLAGHDTKSSAAQLGLPSTGERSVAFGPPKTWGDQ